MLSGSYVAEDSVTLDENLCNIRHQPSCIPECEAPLYPASYYFLILLVLVDSPQISRTEHLRFLVDGQILMGNNPFLLNQCQFLYNLPMRVINQRSGPWPINNNDGIHLLSQLPPNEPTLISPPNGVNATYCKVGIDDGTAIQWIIGDYKSLSFPYFVIARPLLTCKCLHKTISFQVLFDDLVASNILVQLLVTELIGTFQDKNRRVPQKNSYFLGSLQKSIYN